MVGGRYCPRREGEKGTQKRNACLSPNCATVCLVLTACIKRRETDVETFEIVVAFLMTENTKRKPGGVLVLGFGVCAT